MQTRIRDLLLNIQPGTAEITRASELERVVQPFGLLAFSQLPWTQKQIK
uniref:Uncharacterized protein n=1 Tax=Arundo donax TaxID=35708 RepID=A0A0A9NCD9_ARUDO